MKRKDFEKFLGKTIENVSTYRDAEGQKPSVSVKKLLRRKVIELTFWHGTTPDVREELLSGYILGYHMCGYPIVFDNHMGGGVVECYIVMWTDRIE